MSDAAPLPDLPYFTATTENDIRILVDNIREVDRKEIYHSTGMDPLEPILHSLRSSRICVSAWAGGHLLCVFGVAPYKDAGAPWMIGTTHLPRVRRTLLSYPQAFISVWKQDFPKLENYVWSKNDTHVRWLKRLGFVFTGKTIVSRGEIFLHFEMKETHVS